MTTTTFTSPELQRDSGKARAALILVLGAESAIFSILIMVYVFLRTNLLETQSVAPDLWLPSANTVVLAISAGAAWWALRGIRQDRRAVLAWGSGVALVLGLIFVIGQIVEFQRSGMTPADHAFGGIYFTLIGFHALHVLVGVSVLAINWVRARLGDFSARSHVAVEMGVWFWTYVTGVWFVLFAALYLI